MCHDRNGKERAKVDYTARPSGQTGKQFTFPWSLGRTRGTLAGGAGSLPSRLMKRGLLMDWRELVGNVHIHTTHSDGNADHATLAEVAAKLGLDFLIVTDHSVYAGEAEGWYGHVLVLVGEEVHNPHQPACNHYLVFNAREEMAPFGDDPQRLINAVGERGGIGFIAHPYEHSAKYTSESEINWVDWRVTGYSGLEIWNYMSEFKSHLVNLPLTLLAAYAPKLFISGPYPETLAKWDQLLAHNKVWGLGGSDAHGTLYRWGPLQRPVFSYEHLFAALNTHILVTKPWSDDASQDARLVYRALATGRCFVGYDALAPTRGFRFFAEHGEDRYTMGDELIAERPVHFRVYAPRRGRLRLLRNGSCVAQTIGSELVYATDLAGAYRVECHRRYFLKPRGWIYSNPIFVRSPLGRNRRRGRPACGPRRCLGADEQVRYNR